MVSKCRRCIFGCFDALPRNIIGWIKIHQLIFQKEMPDNFQHFKYLSKIFFSHLPWWSCGRVPSPLSEGLWFKSPLNFHGSWHIILIKIAKCSKTTFAYRSTFYLFYVNPALFRTATWKFKFVGWLQSVEGLFECFGFNLVSNLHLCNKSLKLNHWAILSIWNVIILLSWEWGFRIVHVHVEWIRTCFYKTIILILNQHAEEYFMFVNNGKFLMIQGWQKKITRGDLNLQHSSPQGDALPMSYAGIF